MEEVMTMEKEVDSKERIIPADGRRKPRRQITSEHKKREPTDSDVQRTPVWKFFMKIDGGAKEEDGTTAKSKNNSSAQCKKCGHILSRAPKRLLKHISLHCPRSTDEERTWCKNFLEAGTSSLVRVERADAERYDRRESAIFKENNLQQTATKKRRGNSHIQQEFNSAKAPTQKVIKAWQKKLGLALVSAGIPLEFADNIHFLEYQKLLNPNYSPPQSSLLKSDVLDALCFQVTEQASSFVKEATFLTLTAKGFFSTENAIEWSLINERKDRCILLLKPTPMTSGEGVASIAEIVEEIRVQIAYVKVSLNGCIRGFAIENVPPEKSSLLALRKELKMDEIITGTCLATQCNYIFLDLLKIPSIQKLLCTMLELSEQIENNPVLMQALHENSIRRKAFWVPQTNLIKCIVGLGKQFANYKDVLETFGNVAGVLKNLADKKFWDKVEEFNRILRIFSLFDKISEKSTVTCGKMVAAWALLNNYIHSNLLSSLLCFEDMSSFESFRTKLINRASRSFDANHYISMVLDPRVYGSGLSTSGLKDVREMAFEFYGHFFPVKNDEELRDMNKEISALLEGWQKYLAKERPFHHKSVWHSGTVNNPLLFWKDFEQEVPELARLAHLVNAFSPQVLSCDKAWSSMVNPPRQLTRNFVNDVPSKIYLIKEYDTNRIPDPQGLSISEPDLNLDPVAQALHQFQSPMEFVLRIMSLSDEKEAHQKKTPLMCKQNACETSNSLG